MIQGYVFALDVIVDRICEASVNKKMNVEVKDGDNVVLKKAVKIDVWKSFSY